MAYCELCGDTAYHYLSTDEYEYECSGCGYSWGKPMEVDTECIDPDATDECPECGATTLPTGVRGSFKCPSV